MTAESSSPGSPQDSRREWLNLWNWPMGIWVLVIGFLLLLLPFVIRTVMLAGVPPIPEPFDVAEFCRWDVPADEDAFTDYRTATSMRATLKTQGMIDPDNYDEVIQEGWSKADDTVTKWLDAHRESLKVWRNGSQKSKGRNLSPDKLNFASVIDTVQELRAFARLALVEEARCLDAGELNEARQWARAAFRSGGHATYRGCLIQGLLGSAIHAISTAGLERWAQQPEVTAEQLQSALAEAQSDFTLFESRSNILKAETLVACNSLASPQWLQVIGPANSGNPDSPAVAKAMQMGLWVIGEPEFSGRTFRHILANQIREIDKPVAQRQKLVGTGAVMLFDIDPKVGLLPGQLDPAAIDRAFKRSFVLRILAPAMKQFDSAMLRMDARQATFEAMLAAQAYRRDHGEFPENLGQLVPKYLAAVPVDPCDASGGPILYRREEPLKAVVYSVGDDGNDGGGDIDSIKTRSADVGFDLK
jgi:hypothetical protein